MAKLVTWCVALGILLCTTGLLDAQDNGPVFRKTVGEWTVNVYEETGPGDSRLRFAVRGPRDEERQVWLDRRTRRIVDVALWNNSVFVVMDEGSAGSHVNIVPVSPERPTDFFLCYQHAVSPDGRFVAFRKFFPRNLDKPTVYLAYDVAASPQANRMTTGLERDDSNTSVGWAFYPDAYRAAQIYNWSSADEPAWHELRSPLTWISPSSLAFVDYSNGKARVVVADFAVGVASPTVREQELDETTLVDSKRLDPGIEPAGMISAESISASHADDGSLELTLKLRKDPLNAIKTESVVVRF